MSFTSIVKNELSKLTKENIIYDRFNKIRFKYQKSEEQNLEIKNALTSEDLILAYLLLDEKNIDIHFEKAFGEYAGSYQAINYLFLKNQASNFEFVNREEDMGEPGLREAKLSYNPVMMLKKYQMEIL